MNKTIQTQPEATNSQNIIDPAKFWEDGTIAGKPRFMVASKAVINTKSDFGHKLLCDGLTFTAGHACTYKCAFCYVAAMMRKNKNLNIILKTRGLNYEDIVVEIADAASTARKSLLRRGQPRFADLNDTRVIYASPLVDIAATMDQVKVTVEICRAILELTYWQIRLLSKSTLLLQVAKQLVSFKSRLIFGFSTGTLDDGTTKSFEIGTALVSKRLAALKHLQDEGFRTFGMLCPILPPADYDRFAEEVAQRIDVTRTEHVWAEILNSRGDSMLATIKALRNGGCHAEAQRLDLVTHDKGAWDAYAEQTFLALTKIVPAEKLRFLQYVKVNDFNRWKAYEPQGAVLLGNYAKKVAACHNVKIGATAPTSK
jgi:DNA repair photolyase